MITINVLLVLFYPHAFVVQYGDFNLIRVTSFQDQIPRLLKTKQYEYIQRSSKNQIRIELECGKQSTLLLPYRFCDSILSGNPGFCHE